MMVFALCNSRSYIHGHALLWLYTWCSTVMAREEREVNGCVSLLLTMTSMGMGKTIVEPLSAAMVLRVCR